MFSTLINAFRDKEIRKKLLITFGLLFLFVMGTWIPVPGIDSSVFETSTEGNVLLNLLSSVSGGALSNGAILALGVTPYITASIIIQLLSIAIPSIEKLTKMGDEGRKKINVITRYVALFLSVAQAVAIVLGFNASGTALNAILFDSVMATSIFVVVLLVAGAMFTVFIGEKITEIGIGNGLSLLIFIGILSSASIALLDSLINVFSSTANLDQLWNLIIFLLAVIAIFALIIFIDLAKRKIPVTYAKQVRGRKMMGGQTTELALKVHNGGVMPIIFASALVTFPQMLISMFWTNTSFGVWFTQNLGVGTWVYSVFLAVFIFFFTFFFSQVIFKPDEVAKRIQENGGMIASYRPGRPTVDYLRKVNNRLLVFGALFLAFIALIPTLVFTAISGGSGSLVNAFTATGMLIIVSVALEFNKGLDDQIIVRNYKGFLK